MNYWLHRISYHSELSYPLLKARNLLSTGWSDFSEKDFVEKCSNNWENFEKSFDENWGKRPRRRYDLWRFISEMKKGDYVLVPSWGTFSIYELTNDKAQCIEELDITNLKDNYGNTIIKGKKGYLYKNDDTKESNWVDLGFFRSAKPVVIDVSRYEYADSPLTSRMKIYQTNASINDLKTSVDNAIESFRHNKPINLQSLIFEDINKKVLSIIKKQLNPDKFEKLIKWYFAKAGANEVIIPPKKSHDKVGDADIIATFKNIKTIIYIQAKYHDGETSSWALEQINEFKQSKDAQDDGNSRNAWVITSGDNFSEDCYALAKNSNVILVNGLDFVKMLIEIGISDLDTAFE